MKVRDVMTAGAECIGSNDTLSDAARRMRDLDVGSMPICGDDGRLHGMLTDRDIVVRCVAENGDPTTTRASELAQGTPVWVGADDDLQRAMQLMADAQVRRLPVIDDHQLVGIVSQADVARHGSDSQVGALVEEISER